jgi:TolB-like protein
MKRKRTESRQLLIVACIGWVLAIIAAGTLLSHLVRERREQGYDRLTDALVNDLKGHLLSFHARDDQAARVAVVNFTDLAGANTNLGAAVAARITAVAQLRIPHLTLVDRAALNRVLDEQKLGVSGLVGTRTSVRIGELTGAQYILSGQAQIAGDRIIVAAALTDAETGETRWARSVDAVAPQYLSQLSNVSPSSTATAAGKDSSTISLGVREFVVKNWQWLWTVVLVPLFAWAFRRKARRPTRTASAATAPKADGA